MELNTINRGMRLDMIYISNSDSPDDVYSATFHGVNDVINEMTFVVKCPELNRRFVGIDRDYELEISFSTGPHVHVFSGYPIGKIQNDMVIIEKTSDIVTENRRKYQRDEIRVEVKVYPLHEDSVGNRRFTQPDTEPLLHDTSFDLSSGGMCVITNISLDTRYDPFYLVEFAVTEREWFLLPSKLVRRSNYARSRIGRFDYGFQFLFTEMPDEMSRLTKAILSRKLMFLRK